MKKYAIVVTLICLGLIAYILFSPSKVAPEKQRASASAYNPVYSITVPTAKPSTSSKSSTTTYILNKSTKKFHKPTCSSIKQMKESNKRTYTGTRSQVIEMGYSPCGRCNP